MKKTKYSFFLRLLGVILFIYVLSRINIAELTGVLKGINPIFYLAGISAFLVGFFIRVLRWKILTDSIGADISFRGLAGILIRVVFLGMITPGKLGEFWGAKYLASKTGVSGGKAFYSAFMDRAIDLLVILTVSSLGVAIICFKFIGTQYRPFFFAALIATALSVYFFIKKRGVQGLGGILIRFFIPSHLKEKAGLFLNDFCQGFKHLKSGIFLKILALGLLYYVLMGPVFHYFTALSLGISIPFWYLSLMVAMVWLLIAIPVTMFGLGTREAALIYFLSFLGIPASSAVAISLLDLSLDFLVTVFSGAVFFFKKNNYAIKDLVVGENNYIKEEIATQDYLSNFYEKERYVIPYSLAYHTKWAKKMLSLLNLKGPILDNGCGNGFMTQFLQGYEVVGLDISPKMAELAQKRYAKVFQGDSSRLPFENSSFQTVINRGILHHLENPQKAVDEVNRVLAKGGEAVFSETLFNVFAVLPRKLMRGTKHFSHLHNCFKEKDMRKMIEPKFKIKKVYYWGFLSHLLLGFPDVIDIYKFFPFKGAFTPFLLLVDSLVARIPFINKQLCWCIIIIAKKN